MKIKLELAGYVLLLLIGWTAHVQYLKRIYKVEVWTDKYGYKNVMTPAGMFSWGVTITIPIKNAPTR